MTFGIILIGLYHAAAPHVYGMSTDSKPYKFIFFGISIETFSIDLLSFQEIVFIAQFPLGITTIGKVSLVLFHISSVAVLKCSYSLSIVCMAPRPSIG